MNKLGFGQKVGVQVQRSKIPVSDFAPKGFFHIEQIRDGKKIRDFMVQNGVTNVGKNHILDSTFNAASQVTSWYIGLIDSSGYSALAAGDTMSSHAGWNEFTTYSEGTRTEWAPDAAASQAITNGTPATFSITGTGTLKGIFVASNSTKSGTTGTLWATALFASDVDVINTDILRITYTVTAS